MCGKGEGIDGSGSLEGIFFLKNPGSFMGKRGELDLESEGVCVRV